MAFIPAAFAAIGSVAGTVGTVASVASAALGAFGAIKQGQQASAAEETAANMANYNAKVASMRAEQTGVETNMQEDEQRRRARYAIGSQIAASGEAGAGLNPDLLRQSVYDAEADTTAIRYQGALKTAGYTDEVALQKANAKQRMANAGDAMTSGYINAASALTRGAANYYGGKKLN